MFYFTIKKNIKDGREILNIYPKCNQAKHKFFVVTLTKTIDFSLLIIDFSHFSWGETWSGTKDTKAGKKIKESEVFQQLGRLFCNCMGQDEGTKIKYLVLRNCLQYMLGLEPGWYVRQMLCMDQYSENRVVYVTNLRWYLIYAMVLPLPNFNHSPLDYVLSLLKPQFPHLSKWEHETLLLIKVKEFSEMLNLIHLACFLAKAYKMLREQCVCYKKSQ